MKQSNKFLTRCLALLVALAICLGNLNMGLALTVSAVGNDKTETNVNVAGNAVQNEQNVGTNAAGKGYTTLYDLVAKRFQSQEAGAANLYAILTSGALATNAVISYAMPNADELDLTEGYLTAPYQYALEGASWQPLGYGAHSEGWSMLFDASPMVGFEGKGAFVWYALDLRGLYMDEFEALPELLAALKAEYDVQKDAMTELVEWKPDMEQLNRSELGLIYTTIKSFDFTEEDGNPNDAKNLYLRDYFRGIIKNIVDNCCGSTDLAIVDMLNVYVKNGMSYYYQNDAVIYEQVTTLSSYLKDLVADEEKQVALAKLLDEMNYSKYIELIDDLGSKMAEIAEKLGYTNDGIATDNVLELKALIAGLEKVTEAEIMQLRWINNEELQMSPLAIISGPLKVTDDNVYSVYIEIKNEEGEVISSVPMDYNFDAASIVTQEIVDAIAATVDAIVANAVSLDKINTLAEEAAAFLQSMDPEEYMEKFWEVETEIPELTVGDLVHGNIKPSVKAEPKKFFIAINNMVGMGRNIEGVYTSIADGFKVVLPEAPEGLRYEYYINNNLVVGDTYEFTPQEILAGNITIDRLVIDRRTEIVGKLVDSLNANIGANAASYDGENIVVKLPGVKSLPEMAEGFLKSGLVNATLNGEAFYYTVEDGTGTELALQALLNAIVSDPEFTEERIIALAENGRGLVFTADLALGDAEYLAEGLKLQVNLNSVPEQVTTIANGLKVLENNFAFQGGTVNVDGVEKAGLNVDLTLPEKIYELYLVAMVSAGELDKSNINAIDNEIATMYFYEYIDAVMGSENFSIKTLENTLNILINTANYLPKVEYSEQDLAHLSKYVELMQDIYANLNYAPSADNTRIDVTTTSYGLNRMLEIFGIELNSFVSGAIVELRDGTESYFYLTADFTNTGDDFEALVYDLDAAVAGAKDLYNAYVDQAKKAECIDLLKGKGIANAIDFTTDLTKRASELTGQAIIVLVGDVDGDLVVNEATILDLNGHTINGNVVANGHLLIIDSTLSNTMAGGVNGDVSGHVMIMSGNYTDNVTAFLKDGYAQDENGMVHNELFWVERNGEDMVYVLNSDVMHEKAVVGLLPNMAVVAAEIAIDMAVNQYPDAALSINGLTVYETDLDDVIGLLGSSNKLTDVAKEFFDYYDSRNIAKIAAGIAKELIDFEGIADSIESGAVLGDCTVAVSPYYLQIKHVYGNGDDYLTFGLVNNPGITKSVNVGFKFAGENVKQLLRLFQEMNRIVDTDRTYINIDLFKPTYDNQLLSVGGTYEAQLSVDLTVKGTEDAYATIIAVALAYGNPDNRAELVAALNSGDEDALKAAVDKCSVEDVLSGIKELHRFTTVREMAEALGVTISAHDAEIENIWHFVTMAFGEMLEICRITGCSSVLGNLDKDNDGRYVLDSHIDADGDAYVKGYGAYVNIELVRHAFELKLFYPETTETPEKPDVPVNPDEPETDCLWGDVNHDGKVNADDATLVLQERAGIRNTDDFFCYDKADVNGDGKINADDATLILQYRAGLIEKFPVEG